MWKDCISIEGLRRGDVEKLCCHKWFRVCTSINLHYHRVILTIALNLTKYSKTSLHINEKGHQHSFDLVTSMKVNQKPADFVRKDAKR